MSRTRTVFFVAGVLFLAMFCSLFFIGTSTGRTLLAIAIVLVILVAGGNYLSDRGSSTAHRGPVGVTAAQGPPATATAESPGTTAPAPAPTGEAAPDEPAEPPPPDPEPPPAPPLP